MKKPTDKQIDCMITDARKSGDSLIGRYIPSTTDKLMAQYRLPVTERDGLYDRVYAAFRRRNDGISVMDRIKLIEHTSKESEQAK